MKNKLVIISILVLLILILFIFNNRRVDEIPVKDELITYQNTIDEQLQQEIKNTNHTFETPKVIINPYGNSPLTALIIFHTPEETSVDVSIAGKDELSSIKYTFETSATHILPIYGLYPDAENQITLNLNNGLTKEIVIKTEPLPDDFTLPTSVIADKDKLNSDFFFFTPSSTGYTSAYDMNGDVRWYLTTSNVWDIKRLENGRLLLSSNRTVAPPYYMVGLMEMDLLGKVYIEYVMPGGYHHDVYEMKNGNFLVAANNPAKKAVEDYVIEINRQTGEVEKQWDLSNILPMDAAKSENHTTDDWFHNNSVWYDEVNNSIILSGRHQDAIISIDYDSETLNWIIGDPTGWPEDMQTYFFTPTSNYFEWQWSQHAAEVLPNGEIFLFDNGNNRSKDPLQYIKAENNYSRGVIYSLNTNDMTISEVFEYGKERGSSFYSPYISDVDFISNSHYMIHSGGISTVNGKASNTPAFFTPDAILNATTVELLDNEVIFEIQLPTHLYRVEKMSLYPNQMSYTVEKGVKVGSLGKTNEVLYDIAPLFTANTNLNGEETFEMTKESDRLVFSGQFKEGQKVKLILSSLTEKHIYDIRLSNTAYSAMCIDLFNNKKAPKENFIDVTKYINAEGLNGTYRIYLEIDGHLYNTQQKWTIK